MAMGTSWATGSWTENSWAEGTWADLVLGVALWEDGAYHVIALGGGISYIKKLGEIDRITRSDLNLDTDDDVVFADMTLSDPVYEDIRITPGSFDRPGSSDPTIVAYDVNGDGLSTFLYQFAIGNIACFTVQIPHAYKVGEDIKVHIHWTPGARGNEENGNKVGWKIDYSWANVNSNFGTMQTLDLSDACDGTDHKHQMTPDVTITGTDKGISSMLLCNVKRTDTGTDDTWATNTSGNLPMLLEIDFHFPIDSLGSSDWGTK